MKAGLLLQHNYYYHLICSPKVDRFIADWTALQYQHQGKRHYYPVRSLPTLISVMSQNATCPPLPTYFGRELLQDLCPTRVFATDHQQLWLDGKAIVHLWSIVGRARAVANDRKTETNAAKRKLVLCRFNSQILSLFKVTPRRRNISPSHFCTEIHRISHLSWLTLTNQIYFVSLS